MEPITKIPLNNYYILSSILLGNNLKITFQNKDDIDDRKILELKGLVGFIDTSANNSKEPKVLRLQDEGSSYNLDLSLRLQKPHIQYLPEVFIFTDDECISFCFRAVAETIEFREWEKKDSWLPRSF